MLWFLFARRSTKPKTNVLAVVDETYKRKIGNGSWEGVRISFFLKRLVEVDEQTTLLWYGITRQNYYCEKYTRMQMTGGSREMPTGPVEVGTKAVCF